MRWLDRVFGRTRSTVGSQSPATDEHLTMDPYAINKADASAWIAGSHDAIPDLVKAGDFAWVANNHRMIAEKQTELGLLNWRHGLDPRPDFERAIKAYDDLREIAQTHNLARSDYEPSLVYAMLSLMGRRVPIAFHDARAHEAYRIGCYQFCIVSALHDQPLDGRHVGLLDKHFGQNDGLPDRSFLTYFQLLGMRPTDKSPDELVRFAEANWAERRYDRFFAEGPAWNGYGDANELYVDIYLAGVLRKIGWKGEGLHRWRWEAPVS
ncbi:hypothetical protein [Brevundimonas sp. M20]|uniref:hypothetical protein n=1 Tax=Brevundimonas sp. M20 TaxID=2591463 RepID=UPI0011474EDA|nr:hypothetical protein [Brevundimonas sp. M20]QDH72991.1 hypothetical protein FKQ52_05885 [Brevundimonas sp. M20]